ncbi:MAG: hypothetical protein KME46_32755 [Brasilonema angustatum HA4187-MV1]|jgi:hypothetical protein|nr:hypothetical protein [Brasilonema angustatum HA4187-MV1]
MPRGGARAGAGRKPKYGEATKLRRVPVSFTASDVTNAIKGKKIIEQLKTLVEQWQKEAEEAAKESKTQKPPRTYDKALKLLEELTGLLPEEE